MKKLSVITVVLAVLGGVVLTGCSTASGSAGTAGEPMQGMKMGNGQMPACCQKMMAQMQKGEMNRNVQGMTPETMERMQVLMRAPIFLDAPCPIFAGGKAGAERGTEKEARRDRERSAGESAGRSHAGTTDEAGQCPGQAGYDDGNLSHDEDDAGNAGNAGNAGRASFVGCGK